MHRLLENVARIPQKKNIFHSSFMNEPLSLRTWEPDKWLWDAPGAPCQWGTIHMFPFAGREQGGHRRSVLNLHFFHSSWCEVLIFWRQNPSVLEQNTHGCWWLMVPQPWCHKASFMKLQHMLAGLLGQRRQSRMALLHLGTHCRAKYGHSQLIQRLKDPKPFLATTCCYF